MPPLTENTLFIDIETTGFHRNSTFLTTIGLAWQENDCIVIEQWFNDTGRQEEPLLLIELEHFLKRKQTLPHFIHYNGTTFDLPYLKAKQMQYHLPSSLDECSSTDLYKLAKKYRIFLNLKGVKQKYLEECFGLYREDKLSGQELIHVYTEGILKKEEQLLSTYLLHNKEDMEGMVFLQHLIKLDSFFKGTFTITDWSEFMEKLMVQVILSGDYYLHTPTTCTLCGITFHFQTGQCTITIPIQNKDAKYFYSNYKDYYYLPSEDRAIHKSVAEYVEKEYRRKATKENCYIKKTASFLPFPLPAASRTRKEYLKESCCLNLFYENYGDTTAWIESSVSVEKRNLYIHKLLESLFHHLQD